MGATPITALNLVSFPIDKLDKSILLDILKGGRDKIEEAGAVIIGGHSIDDPEPKYGLAVTGLIHPEKILTNSGAKNNDYLVLTKPLGLGILTTGIKRGIVKAEDEEQAIKLMATLNKRAAQIALEVGVNACTDVTGFGLLGHLHEMMKASSCQAEIFAQSTPVLESVWYCLEQGSVPGGTIANIEYLKDYLETYCSPNWKLILGDAQTSGGLLLSVSEERIGLLLSRFNEEKDCAHIIGRVFSEKPGKITI